MEYIYSEEERLSYLIDVRRTLHKHPEAGFILPETEKLICGFLDDLGIEHTDRYGETSVTACVGTRTDVPVIAIRADMDALPVVEKTGLPFASENPGFMHACGHDSHMAMALGAARDLKPFENELPFRLKLIFQPAEECALSGAKMMIDNGVLDDVDYVLCQHVDGSLDSGKFAFARGRACSACTPIEITFHGKTSHATIPQNGNDAIAMLVSTYNDIQLLLTRRVDPFEKIVCSVGVIHGGDVHNVICDEANMKISLRTYTQELNDFMVERIALSARQSAEKFGGTADYEAHMSAPAVRISDEVLEAFLKAGKECVGEENIEERPPKMGSDDFSWYTEAKPSIYYWTGVRNLAEKKETSLHNNDFDIDEKAMLSGESMLLALLFQLAESSGSARKENA